MSRLLAVMGLTACAACPTAEEAPVMGACLEGASVPADGPVRLSGSGWLVQGPGVGPLAERCAAGRGLGAAAADVASAADTTFLRVEGGATFVLGVVAPDLELSGSTLAYDLRLDDASVHVALRDEEGELLYWFASGPSVGSLSRPDGVVMDRGRRVCRDDCGVGYTMKVEVDGFRQELRPYDAVDVELDGDWWSSDRDYVFQHGGVHVPRESCDEPSWAAASMWFVD